MLIRTVLDCRSKNLKFYSSIVLLVASWSAAFNGKAVLEVIYLGKLPDSLRSFFVQYGVRYRFAQPDPDLAFAPTANTVLGASDCGSSERVLLVDNDIVFLNDRILHHNIPDNTLAGAIAGVLRVTADQWDVIEKEIHLPTLPSGQVVEPSRIAKLRDPACLLEYFPRTYINGGVLLLPKEGDFGELWKRHIQTIRDHFIGHALNTEAVACSNMAGLATAAAAHGEFEWLDAGANYRHFHFLLNARPISDISILHMTGDSRAPVAQGVMAHIARIARKLVHLTGKTAGKAEINVEAYLSDYVRAYWENRIFEPLAALEPFSTSLDYKSAYATAKAARDIVLNLVQEFDLDEIMDETIMEICD